MSLRVFEDRPARSLIPALAWPTMFGIASSAVYQLLNTFFVARLGSAPTTAVVLMTPITLLCVVIAQVLGVGASSVGARYLGRGDERTASEVVSASLLVGFVSSAILALMATVLIPFGLSTLLGANANVSQYMFKYAVPALLGQAVMSFCIISGFVVRLEGRTRLSMMTQLVGFGSNALLDVILIWVLGLGVVGAGVGTLLSQVAAASVYVWAFNRHGRFLKVRLQRPRSHAWIPALLTGVPTGAGLVVSNLVLAQLLRSAATLSVDDASSVGVAFRIYAVAGQLAVGFVLGAQGLLGYWIGRGSITNVRVVVGWLAGYSFLTAAAIAAVIYVFRIPLTFAFNPAGTPEHQLESILPLLALSVPAIGLVQVAITVFQSAGKIIVTYILVMFRSGICVPLLFLVRGPAISSTDVVVNLVGNDLTAGVLGVLAIGLALRFPSWVIQESAVRKFGGKRRQELASGVETTDIAAD